MKSSASIQARIDTFVSQADPSERYQDEHRLVVDSTAGTQARSFVYFPIPFRQGMTILSATLRLYTKDAWNAGPTITVQRVAAEWKAARTNWNNQPGVIGGGVSTSHSSNSVNDEWAFDVATMLQAVSDGGRWYGFRITTNAGRKLFKAANAPGQFVPTLDVEWSDAPQAPTDLSPDGGRAVSTTKPVLRFDFTDNRGSTAMQAAQVQVATADSFPTGSFTAPYFDSGTVLTSETEIDLNAYSVSRTITGGTRTNASPVISSATANFAASDVGMPVTGTAIPASTTILSVQSATSATMSANATATLAGTAQFTIVRTFPALGTVTRWWRVRVQDAAGMWSEWSDSAKFTRTAKAALTITNPAASPNNFVRENTPPILWTFSGQTAWQVMILDGADPTNVIHDSGRNRGTEQSYTLPKGTIRDGRTYVVRVRVWDATEREATPGDPAWIVQERTFTFSAGATTGVTGLTATQVTTTPYVDLTWTRATAPDYYTIIRDDDVIVEDKLLPGDALVSGTSYKFTDREASPRRTHTWKVRAVVTGVGGAGNTSNSLFTRVDGLWLYDYERNVSLLITDVNDEIWPQIEEAETHMPLNANRPVRITQAMGGFQGNVTGTIAEVNELGYSLRDQEDNFYKIKERPGRAIGLTMGHLSMRVIPFNMTTTPLDDPDGLVACSFEFQQVGQLLHDARY